MSKWNLVMFLFCNLSLSFVVGGPLKMPYQSFLRACVLREKDETIKLEVHSSGPRNQLRRNNAKNDTNFVYHTN